MKRLNKKLWTLMLAGVCAASLYGATATVKTYADEGTTGVAVSTVFAADATNGGTVDVETATGAETGTLRFTLGNGQSAYLKRDLALKWFEEAGSAKYLNMQFSFKELSFNSVTLTMESASSVVTEEDKATNKIVFSVESGKLYASVNDGAKTELSGLDIDLALTAPADGAFGSFGVTVNGAAVGAFTNIGANFADYALSKTLPLSIKADTATDKQAVVLFKGLNGQKFDNIKNDLIEDTAAPVLVVNEEISSFQFGTAFNLSYEKIDVLKDGSLTETKQYYQYNPADEAVAYEETLSTSTYFMDTVYYTDGTNAYKETAEGRTTTSVLSVEGKEYVSVKVTLGDSVKTADYYLSWYANVTEAKAVKDGVSVDYIVVDMNTEGAQYSGFVADDTDNTNKYAENFVLGDETAQLEAKAAFENAVAKYQALLDQAASETKASSSSSINLPALDWLIKDNGGYRGLRFTISYKTPSGDSSKTASSLLYNGLKFTTSEEGLYEFKVFANDVAGNTMKYYLDGELVDVSTSNVWEIEEIPSFTFTIADMPISVKKPSKDTDKKAEKILDSTYTLSGITVEGASNEKSAYALYRFDESKYAGTITESTLLKVTYEDLTTAANALLSEVGEGKTYATYFDLYVQVYATKIAAEVKGADPTADEIKAVRDCFVKIDEYNAEITEDNDKAAWEAYNKYNWDASAKSFKTVEEGNFFIFADFWEDYLPTQRAAAFKLVVVESEADVIKGESQFSAWVKNNIVSVILFGVAGLMLIAIVILLLVHPNDETLEDVDEKVKEKKEKKEKKD